MKQGQFSDAQIVALLQESEKGEKMIGALCREKGVSANTFYRWRSKFGGMQVKEAQRLKDLEKENARLKRLLVHKCVNGPSAIWNWMWSRRRSQKTGARVLARVGASQRRAFIQWAQEKRSLSERHACRLVGLSRATARYTSRQQDDEAALVERLKIIAARHSRFGYRRAHVLLVRDGQKINPKRVYRLWKREGLFVKRKAKKKRLYGPKQERPQPAACPNSVWTVDFVQDQTISGRKLRMLSVTDEFTRESLAIAVALNMTAQKVSEILGRVIERRGVAPAFLRCDNGLEFIALALRGYLHRAGVTTIYIDPGSPWQNGFAESFHGKFRDEFLNQEVFLTVKDAQVRVEAWRGWYNSARPHSSLGYETPNEFAARWQENQQKAAETNSPIGT